jgi:hypothetical protein
MQANREGNQLERFEVFRTLGTGSFGRVLLCKEKSTSKYVALKMIKKDIVIRLKQACLGWLPVWNVHRRNGRAAEEACQSVGPCCCCTAY